VQVIQSVPREKSPPSDQFFKLAWVGELGRKEIEEQLSKEEDGTFVIRWSNKAESYVLSYKSSDTHQVLHIASIQPTGRGTEISILRQKEGIKRFSNLLDYITCMQKEGLIKKPLSQQCISSFYQI
jgi:hypothetical protein